MKYIKKNYLMIALVIVILLFGILTEGKLFYVGNIITLFQQNMYLFILSSGLFICLLTGGNTDLSCGSGVCLIGAIAATLMDRGMNGFIAFIVMITIGIMMGIIHGYFIGRLQLPSIIVTLASMIIYRGLANLIFKGFTLAITDETFLFMFGSSKDSPLYILFILFCIIAAIYISEYAPIGKHIYALGGNKQSAKLTGINEAKLVMFAYVFMGICVAIAAGVVAGRMEMVGPSLGETYAMDAIAACFIGGVAVSGGKGKMRNVIVGTILMGIINQGMSILGLSVNWQNVIKGIILVMAVVSGYFLNKEGSD